MASASEQTLLDDFDEANRLDKILQAFALLEELETKAASSTALQQELESREEEVARCKENHDLVSKLLADLNSDDGWKLAKRKKDTVVYYKYEDGSSLVTTKASTLLPVEDPSQIPNEFVKLVALFNESDLMPKWFPNHLMHSCDVPQQVSTFAKYLHMLFHPPVFLPVSKRDAVVLGRGYDMTEHGALAISYESKDPGFSEFGYTVPEPTSKYTRVYTKGVYYVEIADEGIVFKTVSLLDIKLPMIPSFILNLMSKQGPFDFIMSVKKHWRHFDGSPWESRLTSNSKLYDDVRERVTAYMGANAGVKKVPLKVTSSSERPKTLRKRLTGMFRKKAETPPMETGPKKFGFEIGSQAEETEIEGDDEEDDEEETTVVPPVQQMIQAGGEIIKRVSEASEGLVRAVFETVNEVKETVDTIKDDGKEFVGKTKKNVKELRNNMRNKVEM